MVIDFKLLMLLKQRYINRFDNIHLSPKRFRYGPVEAGHKSTILEDPPKAAVKRGPGW